MDRQIRLASPLQFDSIVDGPGIRCVIWVQGCKHNCLNCHNSQTLHFEGGTLYPIDDLLHQIYANPLQSGVTISGGDPFFQAPQLLALVRDIVAHHKNIWVYTGFTYEELLSFNNPFKDIHLDILKSIDVLVDGKFVQALHDPLLLFRGSSNQRLIDMKKTLKNDQIMLYEEEKW